MSTFASYGSRYRRSETNPNDKVVRLVRKTLGIRAKRTNTVKEPVKRSVIFLGKAEDKEEKKVEKTQGFLENGDHHHYCVVGKKRSRVDVDDFVGAHNKAPKTTMIMKTVSGNDFELKRREKIQKQREESRRKLEELEKTTVVTDDLSVELELMRLMGCKTRGWFTDYRELGSWHPTRMEGPPVIMR